MESYAGMDPEALEGLTPEERYQVYKMIKVREIAHLDGALEVSGALAGPIGVGNAGTASPVVFLPAPPEGVGKLSQVTKPVPTSTTMAVVVPMTPPARTSKGKWTPR